MIDTTSARDADLQPFADQLIAIAEQLRAGDLSSASKLKDATNENMIVPGDLDGDPVAIDPGEQRERFAEMARVAYANRRKRTVIFGDPELFGEPAWDILLDLYIAQVEGKAVSVSSACIGSASPPTTGLRWLGVLAEQGLIHREHDPQDQRRVLVRLTDKALDAMDDYFASSAGFQTDRRAARA